MTVTERKIDLDFFENIILVNLLKRTPEANIFASFVVDHLDQTLFKDKVLGTSFGIVKDFFLKNSKLPNKDEIGLYLKNKDARTDFSEAIKKLRGIDIDFCQEELLKNCEYFIRTRKLHKLFEKCAEDYSDKKQFDEQAIYAECSAIEKISFLNNLGIEFVEYANEFCDKMQEPEFYIKTGYPTLDEMLGGGLYQEGKAFYCFTGETNIGKSMVLSNLAWNIYDQGHNVLIISLEMSEFRYYRRIATISSQIEQAYLKQKTNDFLEFVTTKSGKGNKLIIKEFPPRSISSKGIHAYIEKLKSQKSFKPDVIIIDYHGLVKPSNPHVQKHEALQLVVQELRALSYLHEAPIISVAQLNRSGSGAQSAPGLDKMASSWDMASDMDFILSLWQSDTDKDLGLIRYTVRKTRDTKSKSSEGAFEINSDTLKFKDANGAETTFLHSNDENIIEKVYKANPETEVEFSNFFN